MQHSWLDVWHSCWSLRPSMRKQEQHLCLEDHQVSMVEQDQGDKVRVREETKITHNM